MRVRSGCVEERKPSWKRFEISWEASAGFAGFLGGVEEASLALNSTIFEVTLSMLRRAPLALQQFSCRSSVDKCFERVWNDLGSVLRVVWR